MLGNTIKEEGIKEMVTLELIEASQTMLKDDPTQQKINLKLGSICTSGKDEDRGMIINVEFKTEHPTRPMIEVARLVALFASEELGKFGKG